MVKWLISCLVLIICLNGFEKGQVHAETTGYQVDAGDTMWKIARLYDIALNDLIASNSHIDNPTLIYPGDHLNIPVTEMIEQVVELTNQARNQKGLQPLQMDRELNHVAAAKARDMDELGYFSHHSPTYGSPFMMLRSFQVEYLRAAENIAASSLSPNQVVAGWLDHPGHRKNILNPRMTHIGVGYAEGEDETGYWTQMFIQKEK